MTEWRKVRESPRPMMARAAAEVQPLAQVVGDIPDVHVIAIRERRVTVDYPTIIQHNVNTDTIELDLDGEWDGMSVVLVLGPCGGATELAWHGEPLTLPSALAEDTGGIDVSVVGYSADGDTRLVTVAAPSLLNVIKSGCTVGEAPAEETPDLIGQLVAAGDAANKAAQAANAAAEAANGAAVAANTAASAANTAAGKADTAATKATDAATEATDAAGDATRAAQSANAAAEAAGAAAEAARGNVLKGTLGPAPILSADDAYATKPRRLTVYGETRQNLWVNPSGKSYGVTVTSNDDGSMTLGGTATSAASVSSADSYIIKPSTAYTLSMNAALTGASFVVTEYDASGSQLAQHNVSSTSAASFTSSASVARCVMSLSVQSGQAVSGTYRVMLNEGSEPEPWCPPGLNSVDELSVVTAGKNICDTSRMSATQTKSGVTFTNNGDGSFSASGTATASINYTLADNDDLSKYLVPGMTVYVNTENAQYNGDTANLSLKFYMGADQPSKHIYNGSGVVPEYVRMIFEFWVGAGTTVDLENVFPYVLVCSKDTGYEPFDPMSSVTPIDLQGHTLKSLPDGTRDELHIDGTGAVTLVQRVGVATAPTAASGGSWETAGDGIASFTLLAKSTGTQTDMTGVMRCDKLPVRKKSGEASCAMVGSTQGHAKNPAITSTATAATVAGGATYIYPLATPQTIPLPAVTLPTLPAPTVNVYADAESSVTGYAMGPDAGMEYERDVTIAFDNLQAQASGHLTA